MAARALLADEIVYETPDVEEEEEEVCENKNSNNSYDNILKSKASDSDISTATVPASEAFEVFQGKAYLLPHQTSFSIDGDNSSSTTTTEDPVSKYTRLVAQVNDLSDELHALSTAASKNDDEALYVDANAQAQVDEMVHGVEVMTAQLSGMQNSYGDFLTNKPLTQKELLQQHATANMFKTIQEFKNKKESKEDNGSEDQPSSGITYSVYYNGKSGNSIDGVNDDSKLAILEQRLFTLESLLGSGDVNTMNPSILKNSGKGMCHRVEELEERIDLLKEDRLDEIATRVSGLIQEFQELSKKKEEGQDEIEQNKKINELFDSMESVAEVKDAIPKIVERMKSLKVLHDDAAQFRIRIEDLEECQSVISNRLGTDMMLLKGMEESLAQNMEIFAANIEKLNE